VHRSTGTVSYSPSLHPHGWPPERVSVCTASHHTSKQQARTAHTGTGAQEHIHKLILPGPRQAPHSWACTPPSLRSFWSWRCRSSSVCFHSCDLCWSPCAWGRGGGGAQLRREGGVCARDEGRCSSACSPARARDPAHGRQLGGEPCCPRCMEARVRTTKGRRSLLPLYERTARAHSGARAHRTCFKWMRSLRWYASLGSGSGMGVCLDGWLCLMSHKRCTLPCGCVCVRAYACHRQHVCCARACVCVCCVLNLCMVQLASCTHHAAVCLQACPTTLECSGCHHTPNWVQAHLHHALLPV